MGATILGLLVAVTVAACGGGGSPKAAVTTTITGSQTAVADYNMATLAAAIKPDVQAKLASGTTITDLTCISRGTQSAECRVGLSTGAIRYVAVHISASGRTATTGPLTNSCSVCGEPWAFG